MFKSIRTDRGRSPQTVIGVYAEETALPRGLKLTAARKKIAAAALKTPGFKADAGEVLPVHDDLVLVGLGTRDDLDDKTLRTIGGRLVRKLDRMDAKAVLLQLSDVIPARTADAHTVGRCVGEGMGLANWRVDFFDGAATKTPDVKPALSVSTDDATCAKGLKEGLAVAQAVNEARRIGATPPNVCNPTWMASEARKLARKARLTCKVINYAELQKQGMGGLVNVGKASKSKPCLIQLEYKPARAKKDVKLALVGKTITYDTGGYSLKLSGGMKGMKYDKNGGCAVVGAMLAIAALKLPVHVVALLPAAENMVNGEAYRPDDIITMYNGVSVEVTNTDAEGRLVLADALAYACRKIKPTAILDAATLTGGVVVALGFWSAGYFCNDDELCERVEAAADSSGERVWRLPLWKEHCDFMRSRHADIWNSGPKRDGHPIQGAAFLNYFVDEEIPWAHIDIAGVNDVDGDTDLFCAGPTGFGARLLLDVVAGYAK